MFKIVRNVTLIGGVLILIAGFGRVQYVGSVLVAARGIVQESSLVDRGDITLSVSASGPLQPVQELPMVFLATAKVSAINVVEGQHVLKGQTLALLDTHQQQNALANAALALQGEQTTLAALTAAPRTVDLNAANTALAAARAGLGAASVGGYDALRVKLAQVQVELAKNALWQSQLQSAQIKAGGGFDPTALNALIAQLPEPLRDQVQRAVDAALGLANTIVPSPQEADSKVHSGDYNIKIAQAALAQEQNAHADPGSIGAAQAAIVQAQAVLDRLTTGADPALIAIAGAQVDAAQAAVSLAQYNLARGSLIAPFRGVVSQIGLTVGEGAPLNKAALILIDDSAFHVDIAVDELDVSKVAVGQAVTLTFDALPDAIVTGSVARVADTAAPVAGVVSYVVRIAVDSASQPLRSGLSATAAITVAHLHDVVRVRNRFVRLDRKAGTASVLVQHQDGSIANIPVTLGLRNETYSEVITGLAPGDIVVTLPRDPNLLG